MDALASIVLLRAHVASPPEGDQPRERFVRELETEAAALGWVLSPALREAVARIPRKQAVSWGDWLLGVLQADVGGDRPWVPLFRRFPHSPPERTDRLYVERMLAAFFQDDGPICVLCGGFDTVHPVAPCGHLVCGTCFRPEDYSACPICHRRLDPTDPFLRLPEPTTAATGRPVRLRRLDLARPLLGEATALRDRLAARVSPLSSAEREDLRVLIRATTEPGDLSWLGEVPARETRAVVTAEALLAAPAERRTTTIAAVSGHWETATDVARTIWVLSGGDPRLRVPRVQPPGTPLELLRPRGEATQRVLGPRVVPLSRPLRRAILARLDALPMPRLIEDVLRHRTIWKRIAERLHPFEHAAAFPRASVAFSVLRESRHTHGSAPGRALLGEGQGSVRLVHEGRLVGGRPLTLRVHVEEALREGDELAALDLLTPHPGDLLRRLDHLARIWPGDPSRLVEAARDAALEASPRVTYAAMAALSSRDRRVPRASARAQPAAVAQPAAALDRASYDVDSTPPGPVPGQVSVPEPRAPRVFFPKGGAAFTWSTEDERPLLPAGLPARLEAALGGSLEQRATRLSRFDLAIVDLSLLDVPIPAGTQSASDGSGALPRGSKVDLPIAAPTLRLFLHWVDPAGVRVDLDLSVVLFDQWWRRMDHCDYTRLRSDLGAVHSGDLTSAPAPLGATEFLDLELDTLRAAGVVWAVPVVFSYNDVPFENLQDAIAGVGVPFPGQHFDPAGVLVRYDLTGDSRASIPFVADLVAGTMRWLDLHLPSREYAHSVGTRGDRLGLTVADLESVYAGPTRATAFTLAMTHATARADRVLLRDGGRFTDVDGEPVPAPALDGVVLVVCAADPPAPATLAAGSVVVCPISEQAGVEDLTHLLDTLDQA